ncbi:hypothetical protein [Isoptericola sp. BMS4]|nr:hypothetical protein [Isoptericola sp. BMS4]
MANMNVTYDELRSQAGQLRNGMASFLEQAAQTLSDADAQLAQGIRG